jgi:hypothetical protein
VESLSDPTALSGRWRWERVIEDHLAHEHSTVAGSLHLVGVDGGLSWEESGRWSRSTGVVEVRRTLRIRELEDGWWVLFEDGRPFHPWRPGEEVVHPCGQDSYRGLVTGTTAAWKVRWDVRGPAKDYTMTSVLTPGSAPDSDLSGAVGPALATPAAAHRPRAGS